MTWYRCVCRCHQAMGERIRSDGVDTADPIAAAAACPVCIDRHVRALTDRPVKPKPVPPQPYPWPADATGITEDDGEGAE